MAWWVSLLLVVVLLWTMQVDNEEMRNATPSVFILLWLFVGNSTLRAALPRVVWRANTWAWIFQVSKKGRLLSRRKGLCCTREKRKKIEISYAAALWET